MEIGFPEYPYPQLGSVRNRRTLPQMSGTSAASAVGAWACAGCLSRI
jgi:hypothetical protein